MSMRWLLAVLLLVPPGLACGAYGEEPPMPSLAPSEPGVEHEPPEACRPRFGTSYVMDGLGVLPPGEGYDLDGDGARDNALGFLAPVANPGWEEAIASGEAILLWDLIGWSGPPSRSARDVQVSFYKGFDADRPADPQNNLGGHGRFQVSGRQFDVTCQPTSRLDHSALTEGTMNGKAKFWTIHEAMLGTIELADYRVTFQISQNFRRIEGVSGGVFTLCGLSNTLFPGSTRGTFLDFLVNAAVMQADIDRDGDGLERVFGNGTSIDRCIDGDDTVLEDPACACDPRIADGFSVAFWGRGVAARIVGVKEDE